MSRPQRLYNKNTEQVASTALSLTYTQIHVHSAPAMAWSAGRNADLINGSPASRRASHARSGKAGEWAGTDGELFFFFFLCVCVCVCVFVCVFLWV